VTQFNWIEFELRMQARRSEYMKVFCEPGLVKSYDASLDQVVRVPGFALSDPCFKTIEALNLRKNRQDLCPQINADEHG